MSDRRTLLSPVVSDGLLAAAIFIVEAIASARGWPGAPSGLAALGALPMPAWGLLAAGSGALVWRRSRPFAVLAAVVAAYVVWHLLDYPLGPSLAIFVAMYGIGRRVAEVPKSLGVLTAAVLAIVAVGLRDGDPPTDLALGATVVPLLPWYIGRRVAARSEHLLLLEERAASRDRERAAELRQAVEEERRSIARELHDVVAHRVSLMTVQAGAAQAILSKDPERALASMTAVEEAGRAALDELRHLLDVLGPRAGGLPRAPAASIADLSKVASQMESAGLAVELDVDGVNQPLPTRVEMSAFRIVQESLTNALRHAGPGARVVVRLATDASDLSIQVTDDGAGTAVGNGSGRGLAGMRERAELLGGSFEAGPIAEGGFEVRAILPMGGGVQ